MRCHTERERLKSASVADLADAYRLLSAPAAPTADQSSRVQSPFIPKPGTLLYLKGILNRASCWAIIAPAVQIGFYHVVFSSGDSDRLDCSAGLLEFTQKPVRGDYITHTLESMGRASAAEWSQMKAEELDGEDPWSYNQFAYNNHQDYVDTVILGKGRTAA